MKMPLFASSFSVLKRMTGCRWSSLSIVLVILTLGLSAYVLTRLSVRVPLSSDSGVLSIQEESFDFERFGRIHLYRTSALPRSVVLFVSGQEGWDHTATVLARQLVTQDTLVAGVDLQQYQRTLAHTGEWCVYLGGDFEALSKFVQKKVDLPQYELPVLVGYGAGASLVYATLA